MKLISGQTVVLTGTPNSGIMGKIVRPYARLATQYLIGTNDNTFVTANSDDLKVIPRSPKVQNITHFGIQATIFLYRSPFDFVWHKHKALILEKSVYAVVIDFGFHLTPNERRLSPSYRDIHSPIVLQSRTTLYLTDDVANAPLMVKNTIGDSLNEQTQSFFQRLRQKAV